MLEINLRNAFVIAVKLSWDYGLMNKFNNYNDVTYRVIRYFLQNPNVTTFLVSFTMIFGMMTLVFSVTFIIGALCLVLVIFTLEGLAILILVIMSCQAFLFIAFLYLCAMSITLGYKSKTTI